MAKKRNSNRDTFSSAVAAADGGLLADLQIEVLPIKRLRPYPRNSRTHSKKQIRQIADSIKEFGFTNPILIDPEGMMRIPMKPAIDSETKPATCSDFIPASIPI